MLPNSRELEYKNRKKKERKKKKRNISHALLLLTDNSEGKTWGGDRKGVEGGRWEVRGDS